MVVVGVLVRVPPFTATVTTMVLSALYPLPGNVALSILEYRQLLEAAYYVRCMRELTRVIDPLGFILQVCLIQQLLYIC
jgi:hypothetical protein